MTLDYLPPLLMRFDPPVIAHRGASAHAPENTLAAFMRAKCDGARWIETDIKLTHDGVPVLMHDDTLDRTTDGKGAVADMKWAEMERLDAGGWFGDAWRGEPVPRLGDALRLALKDDVQLNLEIKPCPGRARATAMVALIELSKIWQDRHSVPLISSFDEETLTIAAGLHPECPRGLILDGWRDDWAEPVKGVNASTLHLDESILTRDRVERLLQASMPVLAYTVNDPARAKELLHWGVSAVFSDDPGAIIRGL